MFLGLCFRESSAFGGRAGKGESKRSIFTLRLVLVAVVTLSFLGGNGDGGSPRGAEAESSSRPGGGAGSAFENRDRPILGAWRVAVASIMDARYRVQERGEQGEGDHSRAVVILYQHEKVGLLVLPDCFV